ncbi:MAG TPA: DUF1080 domain-containing protein [Planctomycetota bacterium]|nr:DUF1080 domain-containing protein [Planctomycetota bacterium]HRR79300.1 DUF1080 domain-containing protein [Planctomycetota bacterium]HRT96586.1 DUF1080 domain-containing protein [Planctomycetota bacterium]
MREKLCWMAILAFVLGFGLVAAAGDAPDDEGFVPIFNGKDLTGWDGDPTFWSARDGCIRGESTPEKPCKRNTFCIWRGNDAVKDGILRDFEMKVSFRIQNGNSGIQYRSQDRGNWVVTGYQAEVENAKGKVGFLYHEGGRGWLVNVGEKMVIHEDGKKEVVASLGDKMELTKDYKAKDWNHYRIVCRGNHIQHFLNGVQTIDLVDNQLNPVDVVKGRDERKGALSGIFALQIHSGGPMVVEFKDIKLKLLTPETK